MALTAAKTEGSETKIPETQTGILREIKTNEKVLAKIIDDKKLREVNGLAFAIRDLVNALPGISPDFDTEKKAQLEAIVKSVTALAEELKKSSDARELTVTQVNFTKLQEGLRKIEHSIRIIAPVPSTTAHGVFFAINKRHQHFC